MDKKTTVLLLGLVVSVVGISLGVFTMSDKPKTDALCKDIEGRALEVTIRESKPSDIDVQGRPCDTLTFTNDDTLTREIGFGVHDKHVFYDGISEKILNKGESFTVTLNQIGATRWHDHYHDEVEGYFIVKELN